MEARLESNVTASTSTGHEGTGKNDDDRAREKRERNKLAARRCRMKKSNLLQQLEQELAASKKENVGLAHHVTTLVTLYQKEHKKAEDFRAMLKAMGRGQGTYSMDELIAGVDSGSMDLSVALKVLSGSDTSVAEAVAQAPTALPTANPSTAMPDGLTAAVVAAAAAAKDVS